MQAFSFIWLSCKFNYRPSEVQSTVARYIYIHLCITTLVTGYQMLNIKRNLRFKELRWHPPIASVEYQNIRIYPLITNIIYHIQSQCWFDHAWCIFRHRTLLHQENRAIEFNGEIEGTKPDPQKSNPLCYLILIHFINTLFILHTTHQHANQWFPLCSTHWITHKNNPFVPKFLQNTLHIKHWNLTIFRLPPPMKIIVVAASIR